MIDLITIDEPKLLFGHGQDVDDPRDGLTLFGPLEKNIPFGINYGIIGTEIGISRFYKWLDKIRGFLAVPQTSKRNLWIPFLGFEAIFRIPLANKATYEKTIDSKRLKLIMKEDDSYQRVYKVVNLYEEQIAELDRDSDEHLSLWFIISPESVFKECRPKSTIQDPLVRVSKSKVLERKRHANSVHAGQDFLFEEQAADYFAYDFDNDFRRQMKLRRILNHSKSPIQILRESTLVPNDFLDKSGENERELQPESQVAWNLLSTLFYKAGGKPWKLSGIREGVCYLGMVFKKLESVYNNKSSCCAAQMFLDSGDGVVFKGAIGPWKSNDTEEYHIDSAAAKELIEKALKAYEGIFGRGVKPNEIFIHGRTFLNDEEWEGFSSVKKLGINVVGVRIRRFPLRLFRSGKYPILRGMAYKESINKGYLWTTGFIPRLRTNPFQGFPHPLSIEICRGEHNLQTVMQDILALTKLNYNACNYADGEPITLKFADKIGEILTAGPIEQDQAPLSFKYYI